MSSKGYKQTVEHIKKRVEKLNGKIVSNETRKKMSDSAFKKPPLSIATKEKMSKSKMGHFVSKETGNKISSSKIGKKRPEMTGSKNWRWIKDRTKLQKSDRNGKSPACTYWRIQVRLRDGNKCRTANQDCRGQLEVHHILSWKEFPELRYDINNGITLCHAHHPRKKSEEKRLAPIFQKLVLASKE